jgi:hypothetical protein
MQIQKIRNKKMIRTTYGVLTLFLGLFSISLILSILFFFLTLFNPNFKPFFPVIDVPVEITENATIELKNGEITEILVDQATLSFNVNDQYGFAGVVNYIYFVAILAVALYIVYMLWLIFKSIKLSFEIENPFHDQNIRRIKKIAFAVLLTAILNIIYPLVLKYLWIEKINLLNQSFKLQLSFHSAQGILWALIIFVVAEIYRIGLEIKKEHDLTI